MSFRDDLEALGRIAGVADLALVDFLARGRQAFPETATTADMVKWIGILRTEAPHLFLQPVVTDSIAQERERILAHHPTERMTRDRAGKAPAQKERPGPVPDAEAAAFAGMPVQDFQKLPANKRADWARELQAQQGKG
jgi:hypothetical protein